MTIQGVEVELVAGTLMVSKREAQRVFRDVLGRTDRQARAWVSSCYVDVPGLLHTVSVNDPLIHVNTLDHLIGLHITRQQIASATNGVLGGRPSND